MIYFNKKTRFIMSQRDISCLEACIEKIECESQAGEIEGGYK